ncbi:uncharacterized protein LOC107264876 [Cephus cinctus]|uniref:Uncharacterized protein LOC107264876 n=1 Tax=Cephus cinctus TaxID=211228 RepID=A0AAJ7FFF0_CEPCN|nr:uncharacterized protein LOC107264876 [Cephus cinctus]
MLLRIVISLLLIYGCSSDVPNESRGSDITNRQSRAAGGLSTGAEAQKPLGSIQSRQVYENYNSNYSPNYRPYPNKKKCPLCDSSVYPYCSEKLLHDACCCTDPYTYELPYQCRLADCGFLHANSCKEHRLIANCCCNDEYRTLLRSAGANN